MTARYRIVTCCIVVSGARLVYRESQVITEVRQTVSKYDEWNRCRFCGAHVADPCDPGCADGDTPEEAYDESQVIDGVPCGFCGAGASEPCRDGCVMLSASPDDGAAWDEKPW